MSDTTTQTEAQTKVICDIIMTLKHNPDELINPTGIGVGSHARPMPRAPKDKKVIIPGDSYAVALNELYYVLWDLACEIRMPDEKRELLLNIILI